MSAGYFVRTYDVWQQVETVDQYGGIIVTWRLKATVPGRAYLKSINYKFASAQAIGTGDWTFACAPDAGIAIGDQVRFNGHTLDVRAIAETSSGNRIEALCSEVQ